jgi:diguanylate cyclase (GGDEF)-like protein
LSPSGIIVDANEIFCRWFSLHNPDVVGSLLSEVFAVTEAELSAALLRTMGGSGLIPASTVVHPTSLGARPVLLASSRLDNGNTAVAVIDASREQTAADVGQAQSRSMRESERLQLLLMASVEFANATTAPELAELLAEAARRSFRADWASVHLATPEDFVLVGGQNPLAERWPAVAPPTGARTMHLGRVLTVTDPDEAETYLPGVSIADVLHGSGVHSILVAPISDQHVPLGTVVCYFAHRRTFDNQAEPLIRALAQQAAQVFTRLRLEETIRRSAMLDETTGLPNRRLFEQQFHEASPVTAIMFLDLDGFKAVNDELGHAAGDRLLRLVGQRLRGIFRRTDSVARYGGDEFVAVIDVASGGNAMEIAERARTAIAEPFPDLPSHRITASIGIAVVSTESKAVHSVEYLIRAADRAMYTAKSKGGNRTEYETLL